MSERERKLYDALKRITLYHSPEQLRRRSQKDYGLSYEEALEYAYENVLQEARQATRGIRPPRIHPPNAEPPSPSGLPDTGGPQ